MPYINFSKKCADDVGVLNNLSAGFHIFLRTLQIRTLAFAFVYCVRSSFLNTNEHHTNTKFDIGEKYSSIISNLLN